MFEISDMWVSFKLTIYIKNPRLRNILCFFDTHIKHKSTVKDFEFCRSHIRHDKAFWSKQGPARLKT